MNWHRLACWQVFVLALWRVMKLWGGWWMIIVFGNSFSHTTNLFNEPWNCSNLQLWSFWPSIFCSVTYSQFPESRHVLNLVFPWHNVVWAFLTLADRIHVWNGMHLKMQTQWVMQLSPTSVLNWFASATTTTTAKATTAKTTTAKTTTTLRSLLLLFLFLLEQGVVV